MAALFAFTIGAESVTFGGTLLSRFALASTVSAAALAEVGGRDAFRVRLAEASVGTCETGCGADAAGAAEGTFTGAVAVAAGA
jgi:hypothetical protein